jgi:2,4-dienoyl-CoA reductase-like NADH-dependent reductase (Old Yellow Enzyme family)
MTTLFDPIRIGDLDSADRIVVVPLPRNRAAPGQVPASSTARRVATRTFTRDGFVSVAAPRAVATDGDRDAIGNRVRRLVDVTQVIAGAIGSGAEGCIDYPTLDERAAA